MALTPKIPFVEGLVCTSAPVTSWPLFFESLLVYECVCVTRGGLVICCGLNELFYGGKGGLSPLLALSDALYLSHYCPLLAFPLSLLFSLLYTIPGSHLQDNMNENIHQCYCVICERHSVCAERERRREVSRGGGRRREGVGGGQRTKETNLNEMTCFGGVKSGELGFSVPSPRRHIHLERPDLHVYTPEHINRHKEQTARVKKIGGRKKRETGI